MGVVLALLAAKGVRAPAQSAALPMATTAALAAAVALPIPLFVMARLWTGAFHPKFVPAAGVSICLLAVALVAGVPMGRRWRQTVLIGMPSIFLSVQVARQGQSLLHQGSHAEFASALATLQATVPEPIVIADDALFVELMHYDRQGKLTKCYFVHDALPAERSNVDKAIVGLAALTPLRVVSFDKWIRDHSRFAYIGDETYPLIRRAVADGAGLTLHRASNVNVNYWLVDYRR